MIFFIYLNGVFMNNLISHRGNNDHSYQENTIGAVLSSLKEDYIKGVEIDVQITKDKKLVVNHDYTIHRVSDGYGIIRNMTLKELKQFNFGNKYHSSKIVTLNEMLNKIKSNKLIIIDIKSYFLDYREVANLVLKVVKKYKHLNIWLTSASNKLTEYLINHNYLFNIGLSIPIIPSEMDIDEYDIRYNGFFINYNFFQSLTTNKTLFFWTVNKKEFFQTHLKNITDKMYFITDKSYLFKK